MIRIAPKAISCLFFSLLAVACGDPGDPGFGAESRFDDVPEEVQAPFAEAPAGQFTDELGEPGIESPGAEELALIAPADSTNLIEEIVSGDAVIEPIGGGEVAVEQLSEAELEALGVDVRVVDGPSAVPTPLDDQVGEAHLSVELTRTAIDDGAVLDVQTCEQSFALEIRAGAIAATGLCGAFEYGIDARLDDDGRIEGEITIQHEGVSLGVGVDGVITGDRLVLVFGHERPFPPNFHDFWEGDLIADLR